MFNFQILKKCVMNGLKDLTTMYLVEDGITQQTIQKKITKIFKGEYEVF